MSSISGGVLSTTFTYDPRGNMTAGNGLAVTYTSYDKPLSIARGANSITFNHDTEHQRYKQVAATGTTLYLASGGAMVELFMGAGGLNEWRNYITVAGQVVGMKVTRSDSTSALRYPRLRGGRPPQGSFWGPSLSSPTTRARWWSVSPMMRPSAAWLRQDGQAALRRRSG